MCSHAPLFALPKLESATQAIIAPRRRAVVDFMRAQVAACGEGPDSVPLGEESLITAFRETKPTLTMSSYLPLAHQLERTEHTSFVQRTQDTYLERLRRTNVLHIPGHSPRKKAPPPDDPAVAEIYQQIRAVLTSSDDVTKWVVAFKQQALFRSDKTAEHVAYDFAKLPQRAASTALHLVQLWLQTDDSALLNHSPYPHITELALVQAQAAEAARQSDGALDSPAVLRELRADVVCVTRALQDDELNKCYQVSTCPTKSLYDESLWHQPSDSDYRKRYQERLPDEIRWMIVHTLMPSRACDEATAAQIVDCYLSSGLSNLVTWRCQQQNPAVELHLKRERIRRAASDLIIGLPAEAQQTILSRLDYLQDALDAAGVSLPLYNLVTELPGSRYRRRAQARKLPDAVYEHVAQFAGITVEAAKSLIKNGMIYGPLGLIPIREWEALVHPALWSYLHLHKFGRLEAVLSYPRLTETYNAYARLLDCPPLPQQIVTGMCNHFPKDEYYNSGDGEATAGVPRRKSLKLAGVKRLHEEWLLLAVPVEIDLIDHSGCSLNTDCIALCVFDCGSERAVTCCVYPGEISEVEIGITLYNAIWHPYTIEWPLRGLPETILLPEPLDQHDLSAICATASWMHAQVGSLSDRELKKKLADHPFIKQTIADLQGHYKPAKLPGRRRAPRQQMTVQAAQTAIRTWLYTRGFTGEHEGKEQGKHRIEHAQVPKAIRDQGYIMPGFDTVVAGYLLPIVASDVPTVPDGVEYQGMRYLNPDSGIEPGYTVTFRALQYNVGRPQAVFAAYGDPPCLHYLELAVEE